MIFLATSNGNWTTDAGVNNLAWVNANNDIAIFGGSSGTATLGMLASSITTASCESRQGWLTNSVEDFRIVVEAGFKSAVGSLRPQVVSDRAGGLNLSASLSRRGRCGGRKEVLGVRSARLFRMIED